MGERRCLWLRIFDHRLEASVTASRGEAVMGRPRSGGWRRASSTQPVMLEFFLLAL